MRFEAVYKGTYAHQITAQLQQISTGDELKQLIAKHISDKYQFYDVATDDPLQITEDLAGIALGAKVGVLSCSSPRDNTIRQSIRYLKENSDLFAIFRKVYDVWGFDGERELYLHLNRPYSATPAKQRGQQGGKTVSAPVIKCKKTPRKKCRFVAEVKGKR